MMDKESILIFGAGLNQYLLIKAARELGVTTVVLDPNPRAPGRLIADYFYIVKGDDYETTKEIALKHRVSGIATTQMEKPLRLMAKLAQELGLSFHSPEVVERSLDKWIMKQTFLKNNIPCAKGILFKKNDIILEKDLLGLEFPLVIKPKDATSSQGVFRVETFKQIKEYENITRSFSRNGEIIVEEFMDGPEYSVESITFQKTTKIIQYTQKFITPFPRTVELGHLQPANLSEKQKQEISEVVINAINSIGIDNSASHTEIKITSEGPKIVEIGARGGGDFISSYLTLASTGISMDKAIIQVALNRKPDLEPISHNYSYIKYFELPIGKKVIKIEDYSDIMNEEDVVFVNIALKPGDIVEEITESKKRPGCIILKNKSLTDLLKNMQYYEKKLLSKIFLG